MRFLKAIQAFNEQLRVETTYCQHGAAAPHCHLETLCTTAQMTILIIDRSFSMNADDYPPSRLKAAKEAAVGYVLALAENAANAKIAVISFGNSAKVAAYPTSVSSSKQIIDGIDSISIEGGTNIASGLKAAMNILANRSDKKYQRQIVLLTDGFGGCPPYLPAKLKQRYNTVIDVVGIGGSPREVNETLLRKIATTDSDGCHYRFIKDAHTLKQHYQQLATGLVWKGCGR